MSMQMYVVVFWSKINPSSELGVENKGLSSRCKRYNQRLPEQIEREVKTLTVQNFVLIHTQSV